MSCEMSQFEIVSNELRDEISRVNVVHVRHAIPRRSDDLQVVKASFQIEYRDRLRTRIEEEHVLRVITLKVGSNERAKKNCLQVPHAVLRESLLT